ncbi:glycerol-3-phosphate dehydrogenase [Salipaludibacillus aurantiacus]|uniref:Glycerol-3-phosphate dehydrogenase n=2 Tax=Salipaludibacillus aurantiacus TaxID=1601833 RepID=A0A1H9VXA4_9BACI|nr:glycerol-3-phosphate dehydrogenase [Salipaludibacillus aurantiacus]
MYDVTIIGAGIVGTSIAREFAKYELKTVLVDKENDVSNGTTKANSAIVHAGFDCKPGTLKAETNVRGNALYEQLCKELDVPFKKIGSFVTAFNEQDLAHLKFLKRQGEANGVQGLEILSREEVLNREPNLSQEAIAALYAPTAGIVGSFELAIALAENAADNGVEILLNSPVTAIEKTPHGYRLTAGENVIESRYVINCAGLYADKINNLVNEPYFEILPFAGEYNLFDRSTGDYLNTIVFQPPSDKGKGVVALPTVEGNFLIGPTSDGPKERNNVKTTRKGMQELREKGMKVLPDFPFHKVITSFTGLRAKTPDNDFIIDEPAGSPRFINVAAIDSPGLTAAPAIAEKVVQMVKENHGLLVEDMDFIPSRRPVNRFIEAPAEEKARLINYDPRYGRIICRCENITEGDIVDMIHRNAGAETIDGVKRRVRAGAGRCQGGFCAPRVMEILAREMNVDITSIVKDKKESYLLTGETKAPAKEFV